MEPEDSVADSEDVELLEVEDLEEEAEVAIEDLEEAEEALQEADTDSTNLCL